MSLPTKQSSECVSAFAMYKRSNVSKSGEDVSIESSVNTSASVGSSGDTSMTRPDNSKTTLTKSEETYEETSVTKLKESSMTKLNETEKLKLGTNIYNRKRKRLLFKKAQKKKKRKMDASLRIVQPTLMSPTCISSEDCESGPFFEKFNNSDDYESSLAAATDLFSMFINPLEVDFFFENVWEKKAVLLQRHRAHYNEGWFSTKELDAILRENFLEYSTNIDITTYEGGVRNTHNPTGRATAATVWEYFKSGCSVRLLNPQSYSKGICLLNSTLQELFGSCMGANVYLTPSGSQGFAPHYDDIEAFVMQLEGKKKWKLYHPRNEQERLPRFSSPNFTEGDLVDPILEVILEPGDLLYFPRGTIHQAATLPDEHSLHVTISTFQKNTWADLFEKLLPAALDVAVAENPEFRSGLPLDYLQYAGIAHSDSGDPRRADFFKKISDLFSKFCHYASIDTASDQMGVEFIHGSLPPCTTERESCRTVTGGGDRWGRGGDVVNGMELNKYSRIKLIRLGAIRLVIENDGVVLYSSVQNSTLNSVRERSSIPIDGNEAMGIEYLIHSYPDFVTVDSIPLESNSALDKIDLCCNLYLQGLLMTESA